MASVNAVQVAKKVAERVGKGKMIKLGEIIRESGYSHITSLTPQRVTETKSYMEAIKPVAKEMENLRQKAIREMHNKDLSKERLDTLSNVVRNLTHDIQLVSGKNTSKIEFNDYRNLTDEELITISRGEQGISE
jgi:hypothetical protein